MNIDELSFERDVRILKEAHEVIDIVNSGEGLPESVTADTTPDGYGIIICKNIRNTGVKIWEALLYPNGMGLVHTNNRLN